MNPNPRFPPILILIKTTPSWVACMPAGNPQTQDSARQVLEARARLLRVRDVLKSRIIGQDKMIDGLIYAVVGKLHVGIIGPPGTSKTMLVMMFSQLVDAPFFYYQFHRHTTPDEILGPVNIKALVEGRLERVQSRLFTARFALFDEAFNASSAVLNMLLSILNEGVVFDPFNGPRPVPLWTAVATSNKVPEGDELMALYDRFPVRVFVKYLDNEDLVRKALFASWNQHGEVKPIASMGDIELLHNYSIQLAGADIPSLGGKLLNIFADRGIPLRERLREEGIVISDRMFLQHYVRLFLAYLVIEGLGPNGLDFGAVAYGAHKVLEYLAPDAEGALKISDIINEALGDIGKLRQAVEQARNLIASRTYENLAQAKKILEDVLRNTDVKKLAKDDDFMRMEIETVLREARELYQYLLRAESAIPL